MEEKELTTADSLRLIQQMIYTAKQEQKDDGKGWIIWGWLLFLASVFTYINLHTFWVDAFFFWNLFGAFSFVLLGWSIVKKYILKKRKPVRTYTHDLYQKLNTGFSISLLLIILAMNIDIHPTMGFALLLGLYGFWILIYGAVLNFRPSLIGAYITWAAAFASLFLKRDQFEYTMLLHAFAVLCGYIIPGHIANREFNKLKG
ncbi:MAG: hypothetical protein JWP88_1513 [Flaviaesturariibacter sp.]|nr:hypothetical protein [Flaviaesturariibacter sp.]